jgi:hypothetical protein
MGVRVNQRSDVKDPTEWGYRAVQIRRWAIRRLISGLASWRPLPAPSDRVTIVIGCNVALARMISCNLRFLSRQDLSHVDRILIVLDRPRAQMEDDVEPGVLARFPSLPLEFLYYDDRQRRTCRLIGWPWVQSWLSWSIGIGHARTRYVLLHDFDAMLLRPDIVEERYRGIRERGDQYVGVRHYEGNGVVADDGLVTTFELVFDAEFVRRTFRPLDLFNQVTRFRGRRVDFDTFLHAQSRDGSASTLPVTEDDMVHPSQLICQFEDFRLGRRAIPASNNLLLIPYFLYAGDEPALLRRLTAELERNEGREVSFFGRPLDVSRLGEEHLRWIAKQARRLEIAATGEVRSEVARYFAAADRFVARAAGREPALASV